MKQFVICLAAELMPAENAYTDARITCLSAKRKFEEYNN